MANTTAKLKRLTPRQKRFVEEYAIDRNGAQAAIRAGYSQKTANVQAARLLTKDSVRAAVAKAQQKKSFKAEVSQQRILKEELCLAMADPGKLFDPKTFELIPPPELPENIRRALASIEVNMHTTEDGVVRKFKYKFWDKGRALERVSKHLGMYPSERLRIEADDLTQAIKKIMGGSKEDDGA